MMNNNMNVTLSVGDKIKLIAPIGPLTDDFVGDVYDITKYENGIYWFECPYGMGCFTPNEFDAHFEIVEDEPEYECCCDSCHCDYDDFEIDLGDNLPGYVEDILSNAEIVHDPVFDNCAVVCCKLPNGYVIVENSASIDPDEFDYEEQVGICMNKIIDKVIALEAYRDMWRYMDDDDAEVEIDIEDEIEVEFDDIDIEKLHKSVREIENKRVMDKIDTTLIDAMLDKHNNMCNNYDTNFRMNPWKW